MIYNMKKTYLFYLIFFTAMLFFWLFNIFYNPEHMTLSGIMFLMHIGLVYLYSRELLKDIINRKD